MSARKKVKEYVCPNDDSQLKVRVVGSTFVRSLTANRISPEQYERYLDHEHMSEARLNNKGKFIMVCPECSYAESGGYHG